MADTILNTIKEFLLPYPMNLPPAKAPRTTPTIAEALIIVFLRTPSDSSHPNLTLITGATWLFPAIAKPAYRFPKPMSKVYIIKALIFP